MLFTFVEKKYIFKSEFNILGKRHKMLNLFLKYYIILYCVILYYIILYTFFADTRTG